MKKIRCRILGHKYLTVHVNSFGSNAGYNSTTTVVQCLMCNKIKIINYDEYKGDKG